MLSESSGWAFSVVASVRLLSAGAGSVPFAPSSAIETVRDMFATEAATDATTWTTNVPLPVPPAATVPAASVQVEPAVLPGTQIQPGVELPGMKSEFAGTVAVSATFAAPRLPLLA